MKISEAAKLLEGQEGYLALSYLLDMTLGELRMKKDEELDPNIEKAYRDLALKRQQAYPLQYALGFWDFYGRTFRVDPRALIPRPETELLVEFVLQENLKGKKILDLGTGTGVIAISLKLEENHAKLFASDLSGAALSLARENASCLGADIEFIQSDLFSNLEEKFSIIVSNPPYVGEKERASLAKELSYEPELALFSGADGLDIFWALIQGAYEHLEEGGKVFLEIGSRQGEAVSKMMEKAGFHQIEVVKDYTGRNRFVVGLR